MLNKSSYIISIIFLILYSFNSLEVHAGRNRNNGILNRFCIASMKSKFNIKNKKDFEEISNFTCKCFFEKYKSGYSIRTARNYCREKTVEKYNL